MSIGILGAYFYIADNLHDTELAAKIQMVTFARSCHYYYYFLIQVPVASLSAFVFAFSIGFGPIPWLMMSELFAPEVKSLASSISTTFNWTLAFLVTKFFASLVAGVTEAGAFWVFGAFTILTFFFCLFFVPETKGKSLDDIQKLFRCDLYNRPNARLHRSPRPYFLEIGIWRLFGCGGQTEDTQPILEEY